MTRLRGLVAAAASVVLAGLLGTAPSAAQDGSGPQPAPTPSVTTQERVVLQGRIFAETEHRFVEYPDDETVVTVVAGSQNVLQAHRTEVYFWPLTNELRTDRERLDEPVEGALEVLRDGRRVAVVEAAPFVLQQDGGAPVLETGPAAVAAFEAFERGRDGWLEADRAYREDLADHRRVVDALAAAARESGEPVDPRLVPDPPVAPEPFTVRSTPLAEGFPLSVPAGTYEIRVVDDGVVVPGSSRRLRAIEPGPAEVSYRVVPEEQWTAPEESDGDGSVLSAPAGGVLYLSPEIRRAYDARDWTRLQQPQRSGAGVRGTVWVPTGDTAVPEALVTSTGRRLGLEEYSVIQQPGRRLGYEIRPAGTGRVDLVAYRLELDEGSTSVATPPGELPGSREVHVVHRGNPVPVALGLLVAMPLLAGIAARRARPGRWRAEP